MLVNWIGDAALLTVHLGFAALLGVFARQAQSSTEKVLVTLGALVYFGSSLWLPLSLVPGIVAWFTSAVLFAYFARRTFQASWTTRLTWLYARFAMLLILVWSAAQGWLSPTLALGAAAAWAGVLAWRRGFSLSH